MLTDTGVYQFDRIHAVDKDDDCDGRHTNKNVSLRQKNKKKTLFPATTLIHRWTLASTKSHRTYFLFGFRPERFFLSADSFINSRYYGDANVVWINLMSRTLCRALTHSSDELLDNASNCGRRMQMLYENIAIFNFVLNDDVSATMPNVTLNMNRSAR